jgi:hypothetical protein
VIVPWEIALVTIYGMYLVANWRYVKNTGGLEETRKIRRRKSDGTVEEIKKYTPPATPDAAVRLLFEAIKKMV